MKNHKKVYFDYFGISHGEFVPCEVCQQGAVDIHHIKARGMGGSNKADDIHNLMALCRSCHIKYGDKKKMLNDLILIHNATIERHDTNKGKRHSSYLGE
jgi:5-methylcytosine-specific restriction endonuclease McrA